MMSEQLAELLAMAKAVPTLELKVKVEGDGKTFLVAGNEPVFRCRSGELGEAYSHLVTGAVALLPKALEVMGATDKASEPIELIEPLKGEITAKIVQSLGLQSELRGKAELLGKLIYAAVEPYVRVPDPDAGTLGKWPARSQASTPDLTGVRLDAVQDFAGWLVDQGFLEKQANGQAPADLCKQWDDSKNA
jgi:hypothetical protein